AEALRKMLLAMVNDLRVVLLRLASRLQTLRFFAAAGRTDVVPFARETLELFAPLANRLGIWQMKWELEDLAFGIIEPEVYHRVGRWVEERRGERESSTTTSPSRRPTVIGRCTPLCATTAANRSRSRSARVACTNPLNSDWRRTGATRRVAREYASGRATPSGWHGCASCSRGGRT